MAYDESLAERVRELLAANPDIVERKMFGGIAWMLSGNMACGVLGDELLVRVEKGETERVLEEPHTREFDFTGKPMRGFVAVMPAGTQSDEDLNAWVETGLSVAAGLPPK